MPHNQKGPAPSGWIKGIRERLGLTQEQLAVKLGTNRETVAKWETGQTRPGYDYTIQLQEMERELNETRRAPVTTPKPKAADVEIGQLENVLIDAFGKLPASRQTEILVEILREIGSTKQ